MCRLNRKKNFPQKHTFCHSIIGLNLFVKIRPLFDSSAQQLVLAAPLFSLMENTIIYKMATLDSEIKKNISVLKRVILILAFPIGTYFRHDRASVYCQ